MPIHTLSARAVGRYAVEPSVSASRGLVVGFHGYGQDEASMMEELQRLPGHEAWTKVSVMALHRFYDTKSGRVVASWMTKLDREQAMADNVAYVTNVVTKLRIEAADDVPLVFVGFSQGAAMAWRAAAAGLGARGLVALGGDLPPDVDAARVAGLPVLIGRGHADTWYSQEKLDADVARLREAGGTPQVVSFEGGHVWTDEFRAAAGVFVAGLL